MVKATKKAGAASSVVKSKFFDLTTPPELCEGAASNVAERGKEFLRPPAAAPPKGGKKNVSVAAVDGGDSDDSFEGKLTRNSTSGGTSCSSSSSSSSYVKKPVVAVATARVLKLQPPAATSDEERLGKVHLELSELFKQESVLKQRERRLQLEKRKLQKRMCRAKPLPVLQNVESAEAGLVTEALFSTKRTVTGTDNGTRDSEEPEDSEELDYASKSDVFGKLARANKVVVGQRSLWRLAQQSAGFSQEAVGSLLLQAPQLPTPPSLVPVSAHAVTSVQLPTPRGHCFDHARLLSMLRNATQQVDAEAEVVPSQSNADPLAHTDILLAQIQAQKARYGKDDDAMALYSELSQLVSSSFAVPVSAPERETVRTTKNLQLQVETSTSLRRRRQVLLQGLLEALEKATAAGVGGAHIALADISGAAAACFAVRLLCDMEDLQRTAGRKREADIEGGGEAVHNENAMRAASGSDKCDSSPPAVWLDEDGGRDEERDGVLHYIPEHEKAVADEGDVETGAGAGAFEDNILARAPASAPVAVFLDLTQRSTSLSPPSPLPRSQSQSPSPIRSQSRVSPPLQPTPAPISATCDVNGVSPSDLFDVSVQELPDFSALGKDQLARVAAMFGLKLSANLPRILADIWIRMKAANASESVKAPNSVVNSRKTAGKRRIVDAEVPLTDTAADINIGRKSKTGRTNSSSVGVDPGKDKDRDVAIAILTALQSHCSDLYERMLLFLPVDLEVLHSRLNANADVEESMSQPGQTRIKGKVKISKVQLQCFLDQGAVFVSAGGSKTATQKSHASLNAARFQYKATKTKATTGSGSQSQSQSRIISQRSSREVELDGDSS